MDSHAFKVIEKKRLADHIDRGAKNMEQLLDEDGCGHNTATNDERPIKVQRLEQETVNDFVEEHKSSTLNIYEYEDSCRNHSSNVIHKHVHQLQALIQQFNQNVTPYSYDSDIATDVTSATVTNIDDFAQECTELLKVFDVTHLHHIDCTMTFHQLHGCLFLWLSYIITSHIPWDVTNIDCFQVRKNLITTTNHICSCLLEIYRITPQNSHVPLPSIESFLILFKTLLFLTKPIGGSNPIEDHDMILLSTLFEVVDYTLHFVDCIRGLTAYEWKQFILCLVQASTASMDDNVSPVGGTHQIVRRMLEQLNHTMDESDVLISKFVQVAIRVVSDPQLPLMERSEVQEILRGLELRFTKS